MDAVTSVAVGLGAAGLALDQATSCDPNCNEESYVVPKLVGGIALAALVSAVYGYSRIAVCNSERKDLELSEAVDARDCPVILRATKRRVRLTELESEAVRVCVEQREGREKNIEAARDRCTDQRLEAFGRAAAASDVTTRRRALDLITGCGAPSDPLWRKLKEAALTAPHDCSASQQLVVELFEINKQLLQTIISTDAAIAACTTPEAMRPVYEACVVRRAAALQAAYAIPDPDVREQRVRAIFPCRRYE